MPNCQNGFSLISIRFNSMQIHTYIQIHIYIRSHIHVHTVLIHKLKFYTDIYMSKRVTHEVNQCRSSIINDETAKPLQVVLRSAKTSYNSAHIIAYFCQVLNE